MYAKAIVIGIVTGLLAPVVIVAAIVTGGVAAAGDGGGGGIAGIAVDLVPATLLLLVAPGFLIGFTWTVWRARTKARMAGGHRSG